MTICFCQPIELDVVMDTTDCNCGTIVCKNCGQDLNPEEWFLIDGYNAVNLPGLNDSIDRELTAEELNEFGRSIAKFINHANPTQSELDEHVFWLAKELKEFGE